MPSKIGWRPSNRYSIKVSPRLCFRGDLQIIEAYLVEVRS